MRPSLHGLEVAVVDVETTGLFPNGNDRIVEIAVVRTTLGTAEQRVYTTLVNPSRDAGPTRRPCTTRRHRCGRRTRVCADRGRPGPSGPTSAAIGR